MKMELKRSILVLLIISIITAAFPLCSYAADVEDYIPSSVKFAFLKGAKVGIYKSEPSILEDAVYENSEKLMLPAEYIFKNLGYEIEKSDSVLTAAGEKTVTLTANQLEITIGKESVSLSVNTEIKNNVWFVSEEIFDKLGYTASKKDGMLIVFSSNPEAVKTSDLKDLFGIYVSPDSKRSMGGTPDNPISLSALPTKLEENVRKYGGLFPTYSFLMGGEYEVYTGLDFTNATFSSADHKKIYIEAYGDSKPVLTGAVELDKNELKPVTDAATLARIPKAGRGKVAYMDLKKYNINMNRTNSFYHYLYLDDKEQMLSRWPNKDYALVKSVPNGTSFGFAEIEPTTWTKATDGYIYGFFDTDYDLLPSKISSVDAINKLITLGGKSFRSTRAGARYYAVNMLEILDMPGEWFVDRENEILYYYPPYSLKESRLEIAATPGMKMMSLGNAQNMVIKGIHFTKGGDVAVTANYPKGVEIRNCEFTFMQGAHAIRFEQKSYDCIVDSNEMYNCSGGLLFIRSGDTSTMTDGNCEFTNNHIASSGYYPRNIHGIISGGYNSYERNGSIGMLIQNNVFQDNMSSYAISIPGQDVKIYNNEVMNQAKQVDDGGSIYFGKSHTFLGCEVMFNYVHDFNKEHSYCALYNDDGYAGAKWNYNVTKDVNSATIVGLGMYMNFNYNLSINNATGLKIGSRMEWSPSLYADDGNLNQELRKVLGSNFGSDFLKKYPFMADAVDRSPYSAPWDVVIYGNVGVNTGGNTIRSVPNEQVNLYFAKEFEVGGETVDITKTNATAEGNPHFSYSDDYFVDPENQDFTVKPESDLAKAQPELLKINMQEIGLTKEAENILITPEDGFRLRAPMNGDSSVKTKSTVFAWDQVRNASKYRVMIATDKEMNNLVYDQTVTENGSANFVIVDSLYLNTVYYWQVEAIGIARQNQFTVKSVGPFAFKTTKKNELSKDGLKLAIESVTKFFTELESSKDYKYDEAFTAEFRALLDRANSVYKSSSSQDEIDAVEEEIYYMVNKSPYYQVLHYDHLDVFDPSQTWTHTNDGTITHNADGSVTFSSPDNVGSASRANVKTKNSVVCFQIKFDEIPQKGYRGIYFKYDENGKGYLAVVKYNIFEYQGVNQTLFELPNYTVEAGKWYTMECGGINTPGGVLQFWKIDGKVVFAKLDTSSGQTRSEGRIWVQHDSTMHIKKVDKLPEDGTIYDAILKDFNEPLNEGHLASMLIGANDALKINSTFYNVSDKKEIAKIVYPRVSSREIQITQDGDITAYKNAVMEATVLAGYNTGLENHLFQNRITPYYKEYLQLEKIDENGVNLYDFYTNSLKDLDRIDIHMGTLNKDINSFDELRREYARNILKVAINSCGRSFANDSDYFIVILTKENADFCGINIDAYLALTEEQKTTVNAIVHAQATNDRTLEQIAEQLNAAAAEL